MPETIHIEIQARSSRGRVAISPLYTGGLMRVGDGRWVVIDLDGLTIGTETKLLLAHDHDKEVGTGRASVTNGQLDLDGRIDESTEYGPGLMAAEAGEYSKLQASVGVEIISAKHLKAGTRVLANGQDFRPTTDFWLVERSSLSEVSLLKRGADASTRVAIAATTFEGAKMPTTEKKETPIEAIVVEATAAEIDKLFSLPEAQELRPADVATIRAGAMDYNSIHSRIMLASKLNDLERRGGGFTAPENRNERHHEGDVLTCALMLKAGSFQAAEKSYDEKTLERARQYSRMSVVDFARCTLEANGKPAKRSEAPEAILQASSGLTTMSLPNLFSDAMRKTLVEYFREAPGTWRSWCEIKIVQDFHENFGLRPYSTSGVSEVAGDGQIKHGGIDESKYSWGEPVTWAEIISVTRRDLIQDNIGFLNTMPKKLGMDMNRRVSRTAYEALLNAGTFFSSGNENLLEGAGSALSNDSLSAAIQLIRKQNDESGEPIDLMPVSLLVPIELENTAREILKSIELDRTASGVDRSPTGNVLMNRLELVVESRLSSPAYENSSAIGWYVFCAPSATPATMSFLNSQMPVVEQAEGSFNILGHEWRAFHDFAGKMQEFRACVRAVGA